MARTRTNDVDHESGASSPPMEMEEREADTLAEINAILGAGEGATGLKCMVHELMAPAPGKRQPSEPWLFDVSPEDLDDLRDRLLNECGPGKYRVRVLKPNERGIRMPWKMYDIEVSKPRRMREAERQASLNPQPQAPAAAATQTSDGMLGQLITRLFDRMDRQDQAISAIAARLMQPAAPAVAPLDGLTQAMSVFKGFFEMMPKPDANIGLNMFTQGLDMAKKIYELKEESEPKGGFDLMGLVTKALESPLLAGLAQQAAQPRPALPGAGPTSQAGVPAPEPMALPGQPRPHAPAAGLVTPGLEARVPQELVDVVNYLVIKASEGAQPDLVIDWLEAECPDDIWNMLQTVPDPIGELVKLFPAVGTYKAWFVALLDKLNEPEQSAPLNPRGAGRDVRVPAN